MIWHLVAESCKTGHFWFQSWVWELPVMASYYSIVPLLVKVHYGIRNLLKFHTCILLWLSAD